MRKYTILLLVIIIGGCTDDYDKNESFIYNTLFNSCDERLLDYYAIPNDNKEIFYLEEFNSNETDWIIDTTELKTNIENGILIVEAFNNLWFWDLQITINESKNYEIEISQKLYINKRHGISITEYDFMNCIGFDFNRDSEKYNGEIYVSCDFRYEYFTFSNKDFLNNNQFNIITLRKIGNKCAIFINRKLLYIVNSSQFLYTIPYVYFNKGTNMFDYMRVQYIND